MNTSADGVALRDRVAVPTVRPWILLAVLGGAQLMLIIDLTVLNVALPSIASDLRLDRATLTWVATIYTLFFGSLLLLGGRLADTFGRRRVCLAGLALFTVASLASGLAADGTTLVLARMGQGVGAAMLSPAALSIITTAFSGQERTRALGIWAALAGAGAIVGVILGGVLTAGPGWPWIFFINVPIGIGVGVAVWRAVPADARRAGGSGLDIPGAIAITAAIGLLLYALVGAGDSGWTSLSTLGSLALAAIAGVAFVLIERRASAPLVRMELLRRSHLAGSLYVLLAFAALLGGSVFLGALYTQRVLGLSALESGLAFLPFAVAIVIGTQGGAHAIAHVGPRRAAAGGLVLVALGAALLARLPADGNVVVDLLPGLVILALGLGATAVAGSTSAFAGVTDADAGMTSGLVNTMHELGFAIGVSTLATIAGSSLGADPSLVGGYQAGFLAAAIAAAAVAAAAYLSLPAHAPASEGRLFVH
jgi:EmrB/QacA subfamily drug resistance transporter